jgi:hypothetical protein
MKRTREPKCPSCGESNIENFYTDTKGRRTNAYCRECHKQKCKDRWHSKSFLERKASKAPHYGITKEEFLELYAKQEGKCAICNEVPTTERGLHIDHCHTTKRVRGLLCHGCNTGIGAMKENISVLNNAISYLGG